MDQPFDIRQFQEVTMGKRRQPLLRTAVVATAALVALVASPQPAKAATGWDRCPANTMCVFEHANGQGHYAYFSSGASNLANPIGGFVFNDRITSIWNRHPYGFCVNRDANWQTPMFVAVGRSRPFNIPTAYNDRISSLSYQHSLCTASTPRLP